MIIFLMICGALVIGAVLAYMVQQGSGYVLIVWGDTSFEMSIWFGIAVAFVVITAIWFSLFFLRRSALGIYAATYKLTHLGEGKAQQQTLSGLLHFLEGDFSLAQKELSRSARKSATPLINYLAAAHCMIEEDRAEEALPLLDKAEKRINTDDPDDKFALILMRAKIHLSQRQYDDATNLISTLSEKHTEHGLVLALKQTIYVAQKNWEELKKLLPSLHSRNIGTAQQRLSLQTMIYQAALEKNIADFTSLNSNEKYNKLADFWQEVPEACQQDERLLAHYIDELMLLKQTDAAEVLLATALKREWHDVWVEKYGLLHTSKPESTLKNAEAWLKQQPENAALLLALGRLCLYNQQWGRAKEFLLHSVKVKASPEAYAELVRVKTYLGEETLSQEASRKGLLCLVGNIAQVEEFE